MRLGIAPQPMNIPEINRNVYDRLAIDAAMNARSVTDNPTIKVELEREIVL